MSSLAEQNNLRPLSAVQPSLPMRIGIILSTCDPRTDSPAHFVSKKLASSLCSERRGRVVTAVWVSKQIIWLKVEESFSEIKRRHKVSATVIQPMPRLLPPRRPENLDLSYPAAGQETCIHAHAAFEKACRDARGYV